MENIKREQIKETLEKSIKTIESYLRLEVKELEAKIDNLGKIDLNTFTEQVVKGHTEGGIMTEEDIVYIIRQVILD